MLTTHTIGMVSLNISFVLYLLVYLPQILHNRQSKHIENLSISMHSMLYFGLLLDLLYGFSSGFQWQYKTVSIVSLVVMSIQHIQITRHFWLKAQTFYVGLNILSLGLTLYFVVYFFTTMDHTMSKELTLMIGYTSRVCCLLYAIPQIIKNSHLKHANAISLPFIILNITLLLLDTISSWCLDWGWPNKISAPISLIFMTVLLIQKNRHYLRPTSVQSLASVFILYIVRF